MELTGSIGWTRCGNPAGGYRPAGGGWPLCGGLVLVDAGLVPTDCLPLLFFG